MAPREAVRPGSHDPRDAGAPIAVVLRRRMRRLLREVLPILGMLLGLTVTGTVGIHLLGGHGWLTSLYLAVITLATVGSRDVGTDPAVELFVVAYLVSGLGIFSYGGFQLGQLVVNVDFRRILEIRRMEKDIERLREHYVVCGLGRMGRTICEYLHARRRPFVAIEANADRIEEICAPRGWLFVQGDATHDDVLRRAGIDRAQSLASVLPTDADNVYVVLSARMMRKDLQIIARAGDEKAVQKLQHAGATRVVSPFSTGAEKMARFMINPSIEDFLEIADARGRELELADIVLQPDSQYVGKPLSDTDLRTRGVMVIGIRRANGERLMPPPGHAVLQAGDSLFAFGTSEAVNGILGDGGTVR